MNSPILALSMVSGHRHLHQFKNTYMRRHSRVVKLRDLSLLSRIIKLKTLPPLPQRRLVYIPEQRSFSREKNKQVTSSHIKWKPCKMALPALPHGTRGINQTNLLTYKKGEISDPSQFLI